MKKWVVIACIIGLLLFALAWIGGRERVSVYREQVETLEQQVAQDAENQMMRRRLERLKEEKGDNVRLEDALALMPEPARRYYRGGLSNLDDISFFGEVVNQHGNPVSGATFDINVNGSFLAGGGKLRVMSKEDGSIKFKTQGGSFFEVATISHPQCYFVSPARWPSSGDITLLRFYGYQPDDQTPGVPWADHTATNPYIFKMWCAENLEKVISGQSGAVGPSRPREDGVYSRFVTIDLEKSFKPSNRYRPVVEGHDAPGHIRIAMFSEPYAAWHTRDRWDADIGHERKAADEEQRAWWIELSAVDGGLVPVPEDDIYMNEAPETGYQPMIRFEGRDKVNAKSRRLYYYFKANGGQQYGVIVVKMKYVSSLNSGQAVGFSYKMNLEGSRNLVVMGWAP